MRSKTEDVEYMIRDFLEIRYGMSELENARIARFLMNRVSLEGRLEFSPVYGFLIDGILVCVVSKSSRALIRECLLLDQKTGEHMHYQQMNICERLIW